MSKIKEIHARVTEFCSAKENADAGQTGGLTSEATPITPAPTSSAGDKKAYLYSPWGMCTRAI